MVGEVHFCRQFKLEWFPISVKDYEEREVLFRQLRTESQAAGLLALEISMSFLREQFFGNRKFALAEVRKFAAIICSLADSAVAGFD